MKPVRLPLICLASFLVSCGEKENKPAGPPVAVQDPHEAAILEFQAGQLRFKGLIAGIRDEQSFDQTMPALNKIVADWSQVTQRLKKLKPPPQDQQERYRKMISDGHRSSEPIAKDMIRLALIESREEQLAKWLKNFTDAGGAAGWEMTRLYGMTDYSREAAEPPQFELNVGKLDPPIIPLPKEADVVDAILRRDGATDSMIEASEPPAFELGKIKITPPVVPVPDPGKEADGE